jgi:hypothetical protein
MITTGDHFRGPELKDSPIWKLLGATMSAVIAARGDWKEGSSPGVNVVFYVPGSLGDFDISTIEASRFSRKHKLLLVAVPVPRHLVYGDGLFEFVIDALFQANRIAAETFARKKAGHFDLAQANAIVNEVKNALIEQGF